MSKVALITGIFRCNKKLGWSLEIRFRDLLRIMIDVDMMAVGLETVDEGDELLKKRFLNK